MIEVVFFDVGGPIYRDRPYYEALLRAIREVRPDADEEAYWATFERCRVEQAGSFTRRLLGAFVPQARIEQARARATELWEYPPESLQPDVAGTIEALRVRYRLGILANQETWIRETLARDGLADAFDVWAVSAEVGADKPDARIFRHALREARTSPAACAMIGDRLDNDIVPARAAGMRAVWLLRGEAPAQPTDDQLAVPDASIRGLGELPAALEHL